MIDVGWLEDTFNAILLKALPNTPIAWKNRKFTPPDRGCFVRAIMIPTDDRAVTLGDIGHNQLNGMYTVQIYSELNAGTKDQNVILTTLKREFNIGRYIPTPVDYTLKITSRDYSTGGQTSLNDFGKGGVEDNWDVNFITVYWSAREPRNED